jgi:Leucine-rich repeat (LRR) protein
VRESADRLAASQDLKQNKLTTLPEGWGALTDLMRLDVSQNNLAEFPVTITEIPRLDTLDLEGTNARSLACSRLLVLAMAVGRELTASHVVGVSVRAQPTS